MQLARKLQQPTLAERFEASYAETVKLAEELVENHAQLSETVSPFVSDANLDGRHHQVPAV
jgi:hypothetical protein